MNAVNGCRKKYSDHGKIIEVWWKILHSNLIEFSLTQLQTAWCCLFLLLRYNRYTNWKEITWAQNKAFVCLWWFAILTNCYVLLCVLVWKAMGYIGNEHFPSWNECGEIHQSFASIQKTMFAQGSIPGFMSSKLSANIMSCSCHSLNNFIPC